MAGESIGSYRLSTPDSCQRLPRAEQVGQADQVVGHQMQPEHRSDPGSASGLELPQTGSRFDPAKHLLDPPPGVDRLGIPQMAGGAAFDRGAAAGLDVLRHMGRDPGKADVGHEIPGVVALVSTQRLLLSAGERTRHPHGCRPLPVAIGWSHLAGHHQAVAVLHEAMAQVAEKRAGAPGLAEQPRLSIAAGAVGLVGEQQAAEISLGASSPCRQFRRIPCRHWGVATRHHSRRSAPTSCGRPRPAAGGSFGS
jgi:hypothetical protein